jgi:StbA protein
MKLLADVGNYSTITALQGEKPLMIRSAEVDITLKSVMGKETDDSPTVQCEGRKLILGEYATKQKHVQSIVERGKHNPSVIKPYLLSGLREVFNGSVMYLLPKRDRWIEDGLRSKLIGTHEITVNGKFYKHTITDVNFFLESDVAVTQAFLSEAISNDGDCLAIDIGGGTTNYLVMTPDNAVLHRNSLPDVGGISLANDVINSDWMQSQNYAFNASKVMDAIADGSLTYGRRYSFSEVFKPLLNNWFNRLVDHIMMDCRDYMSDVATVMFLGGNASLIRDRIANQDGYYIPENPQMANITALALLNL